MTFVVFFQPALLAAGLKPYSLASCHKNHLLATPAKGVRHHPPDPGFILANQTKPDFNDSKMKPSELFGVFVRLAGFLVVIYGLYELWGGLDNWMEKIASPRRLKICQPPTPSGRVAAPPPNHQPP